MAWECFWLVAFFFCLAGVMGTGAESKSFSVYGANAARESGKNRRVLGRCWRASRPPRRGRDAPSASSGQALATAGKMSALRSDSRALEVRLNFFQRFPLGLG